jgi:hypothetical protein
MNTEENHKKAENNTLLGDVPFTDCDGKPIYIGNIIEQTNFNGEPYTARYEVTIDPADNEVCMFMISGNEKAMKTKGYSSFGNIKNGKLSKGRVVRHIA